jgi:Tfp pilus assembly protein PilF/glutathione synthase/RimK-type ligase-like ATP-grasp enzyme
LRALDALVEHHPDALDLRFARACLLEDLGRLAGAKRDYARILAGDPCHRGALINAATMAYVDGRTTEALGLYRRAVAAHPADPAALVNLGNVLADTGAWDESRAHYERALAVEPDHAIAHYVLARLLEERGDPAAAAHRARAFATPLVHVTPASSATPLRVLMPIAADGGNLVTTLFFDDRDVAVTTLVAESYRTGWTLPAHDLIVNAVADADRSGDALDAVTAIVAASGRPCVNPPAAVRVTGRVAMTRRLREVPGVVVPRTEAFARADCTPATLAAAGFRYPLLLRAPGFHAGRYFVRVNAAADVPAQCDGLPGDELIAIAFVDTRRTDGRYRKYRMLAIDGALVPLHLALARQWKVHYFRGDNAVRAASRTLEADYLNDPRTHLGPGAYAALERVRDALALDYGGIDFTLDDAGNVVVFEANASFAIYLPDDDATAVHRRPFADAAIAAVRDMIRRRALGGQQMMREDGSLDNGKNLAPT